MNEILQLVQNVGEAYVVGQKIIDHKLGVAKTIAINESSKIISSLLSLMIIAGAFIAFLIFSFLLLGAWGAAFWEMPMLTYALPAMLSLLTTIIFWYNRKKVFQGLTKSVVRDLLD